MTLATNATISGSGNWNAGTWTITPSAACGSGLSNYTITYDTGTQTIAARALTVTADNENKTYGHPNPTLNYGYSGLASGDTASVFSGALTTDATQSSNAGSYRITEGTLSAGVNYDISFTSGMLTVLGAPSSSVTLPPSVEAVIDQLTPMQIVRSYAGNPTNIFYADADLLKSLGYSDSDPNPWWDIVIEPGMQDGL